MHRAMHRVRGCAGAVGAVFAWVMLLAAAPLHAAGRGATADVVLEHGRVYTVDPARPWAQAIAVRGGRLVGVGSDADIEAWRGPATRVIDLQGALVTPGFIDAHVHFADGGAYLRNVALRDATTMAEVAARVERYAGRHASAGWIVGEGFSYSYPDLPGGEFHHQMIDGASHGHPVLLNSGMAHAAWANGEALRRAGITRATADPAGGTIVRDAAGEPTGWLKEDAAINLVASHIPAVPRAERRAALLAAIEEAARLGITRVDSAGLDYASLPLLDELRREGRLHVRISVADMIDAPGLSDAQFARMKAARTRYRGELLECCVAKFIMDGVLESHTAYLPEGYADARDEHGMRFFAPDRYGRDVRRLNEAGFQVYTHAIGNGAIHVALDAYEASARAQPGMAPPRNRIEHAEMPDADDIGRFARLGVIASMQPLMIYPRDEWKGMEGLWAVYAGEAAVPRAFALRSLIDAGAHVAFGTDWPIVQLNPLYGVRNAVLRQSLDGEPPGGYVPAQRITVAEAVRAYTAESAYASRHDEDEGSLEPGKRADLVVFSANFIEGEPNDIPKATVRLTMLGGRVVYDARAGR